MCPVCGQFAAAETSSAGDAVCPSCGQLLWWFRDQFSPRAAPQITPETLFREDLGMDSLDLVELIMELEEVYDVQIPAGLAARIKTVADAIRYIRELRRGRAA